MRALLRPTLLLLLLLSGLTGVFYPLTVTGLAQGLFPQQANGSLIRWGGQVVGSELIGQSFTAPPYFRGRPSATTPFPGNAASSGGSNLGPSNPALAQAMALRATPGGAIPVDLLTSSASGLDPHLSPAGIYFQLPRVARARGMSESSLHEFVERFVEPRTLGVLGEPRVNVLRLNLALDARTPAPR